MKSARFRRSSRPVGSGSTAPLSVPSRPGRTTASLGVAAGCYALAMSLFGTTLSLFLADAVGAGPGLIGLYFTGCAVIGVGINLATGRLSDRLSDRRIALAATVLAGVAGALVFTGARNYAPVFATGAVLLGLNEAYISQLFAYVKEFAGSTGREVTRFSSSARSVFSAGWVVGPPVGLFPWTHAGFGRVYAGAAVLLLVTAVLGRWFLPALPPVPRQPRSEPGHGAEERRSGSGMRQILAAVPRRSRLLLGSVTAVNERLWKGKARRDDSLSDGAGRRTPTPHGSRPPPGSEGPARGRPTRIRANRGRGTRSPPPRDSPPPCG
ncbi:MULTISPECIES: MFS transporter [unclassified Streptomyces]|uniref:MFS transporter n=1 Tax=unclassified Streptomyces TaxID=2593676 RepID=UPI0033A772ED